MALLVDQRNGDGIQIKGFDELTKKLDKTNKTNLSKKMLEAAEPIIVNALDAEMTKHPGELQKSLESTGAKSNSQGNWYLAYRATKTGGTKKNEKTNPQKMIFLINREYVRNGVLPNGQAVNSYVIPAYNVIADSINRSETQVLNTMQETLNKELEGIWNE